MKRNQLISAIQELVEPNLYESGYREGPIGKSRPLMLYAPKRNGKIITHKINGFVVQEIVAYTRTGLLTDAEGGGAMHEDYGCFPIEDLRKILTKLRRHLKCLISSKS